MSCPVPWISEIHGRKSNNLRTLVSRTFFIVNSPELSDVKFIFKDMSGSGTTSGHGQGQGGETVIFGHKLILALASPVFLKMFYMDKTNQQFVTAVGDEIHMDDCGFNAEAFLQFIRFLYTDRICYKDLELELIIGVLACADYYDVGFLKSDCVDHLMTMITKKNAIRILEIGDMFGVSTLADKALEFIDQNLGSLVESEEILCIKFETLFEILKRDSLDVDEGFVLDLALRWAGKQCSRKQMKATAENEREVLGKVFFEIRFRLLTSDRISELVCSDMLTRDESLDIVLEVHTPGYVTEAGSSNSNRTKLAPEVEFKSNPRIFGQKKKLMEVDELEKKWKERNKSDYLKRRSLAKARADIFIRGNPWDNKTAEELRNHIERAKGDCIFDLIVDKLIENRGVFRVRFKYNSSEHCPTDLRYPSWFEFDRPLSIHIQLN